MIVAGGIFIWKGKTGASLGWLTWDGHRFDAIVLGYLSELFASNLHISFLVYICKGS